MPPPGQFFRHPLHMNCQAGTVPRNIVQQGDQNFQLGCSSVPETTAAVSCVLFGAKTILSDRTNFLLLAHFLHTGRKLFEKRNTLLNEPDYAGAGRCIARLMRS